MTSPQAFNSGLDSLDEVLLVQNVWTDKSWGVSITGSKACYKEGEKCYAVGFSTSRGVLGLASQIHWTVSL